MPMQQYESLPTYCKIYLGQQLKACLAHTEISPLKL